MYALSAHGGIAQLVEHTAHIRDVYGSIPYAAIFMAGAKECKGRAKGLWHEMFYAQMKRACSKGVRPLLLLHGCCAPCSAGVLWRLVDAFRVIIFYYNPNIAPRAEYDRRLRELQMFLEKYPLALQNQVGLVIEDAPHSEWEDAVGLKQEPYLAQEAERGERCRRCCLMRLKRTKEKAMQLGAQYFATTLTVSPHKDASMINEAGLSLTGGEGEGEYLVSDFKKDDGFLKSLQASKEYGLYRQQYCGCECSFGAVK